MNQWTTHTEKYAETLARVRAIADDNGFVINPDAGRVEKVVGLMTENFVSAGDYYCPCKQSHPLDASTDVVCPCPEWKDEIAADGNCFCRLFYKK
jgi:ferredoxin-thioredoxin reductase catalytic subunit